MLEELRVELSPELFDLLLDLTSRVLPSYEATPTTEITKRAEFIIQQFAILRILNEAVTPEQMGKIEKLVLDLIPQVAAEREAALSSAEPTGTVPTLR